MRRLLAVLGAALALVAGAAPALALETTTFGIDVVEPDPEGRLHIEVAAGEATSGQLRVWNKTTAPLELKLSVVPAQVDESGTASLGGDATAVAWVSPHPPTVELGPGEERIVEVRVEAPRRITADVRTVAVVAEPAVTGDAPAVLQRLAITTYLEPRSGSLIAGLGVLPWVAGAALAAAAVLAGRHLLRRRSRSPAPAVLGQG